LGRRYAPDVKLLGVGAIDPAANMPLILSLTSRPGAALLSWFMARAYSHFYLDVKLEDLFDPAGQEGVRQLATVCPQADKVKTAQIFQPFGDSLPIPDMTKGAFAKRIKENEPSGMIAVPLLVAQGLSDDVLQPYATDVFVKERCAAGQSLDYWVVHGATHQSIVFPGSPLDPEIFKWTRDRFVGKPQAKGCHARAIMGK
jgi:hypothetical protein